MNYYNFPTCGCRYPITKDLGPNKLPLLDFKYEDIKDCPIIWEIFEKGLTLGIFQLESGLGQKWCKELKPTELIHLEALTAILRPGALQALDDKKISMTEHYCKRKNGKEPTIIEFPAIEHILKETYQLIIYQEQAMAIACEVCGFSASEADSTIRKGLGKKDAKLLFSIEEKFISGAEKVNKISKDNAIKLFNWIKAGARYSFNRSHSNLYGLRALQEAYLKTHFPLAFYTAKMSSPRKSKTTEDVANLIYEARRFNIQTKLPDLRDLQPTFYHDGTSIYFGLVDIKKFGGNSYTRLVEIISEHGEIILNFFEFCMNAARYLTPSVVELLIKSGSCDFFKLSRSQMLEEYRLVGQLTDPQKELLFRHYDAQKAGVFNASA